jgi:hypothetical protein
LWELHSQPGTNGFFRLVIDEEQVPYLRIEADGYETVETEIPLTNGLESVFDIQLKPRSATNSIRGTVLLPDGSPAIGVEVALCTAQAGVMLKGTAFEPGAFGNINRSQRADYRRTTDERGAFLFDPKPGAHTVVAVGPAGVGQERCFDFTMPLEIHLRPWGRIEGTVRTRDGAWSSRNVKWLHPGNLTSWRTLFYDSKGFSALSDATGRFTIEHVPPGDGRLEVEGDSGAAPILSSSVQVNPGATVEVQLGGLGRAVSGKLVAPTGVEVRSWPHQVTIAQLHVDWESYHMPPGLTGNAVERWKLEFEDTEDGQTWFRSQYSYDFKVGEDGSFLLPEVLSGEYRLFINVAQGYLGSGSNSTPSGPGDHRVASRGMKVSVPATSEGDASPFDLGEVVLIADP